MKHLHLFLATSIASVGFSACVPNPEPECYTRPVNGENDGPWILADHYHARKQNHEDYVLTKTDFNYQGVFGFRRVFDHLEKGGYNWSSIRTMPLSPERLEGYDVLFINLVSSDRPDFSAEEIDAIIDFVDGGGGLFVIVDHTNVYQHAQRVNPFLEPMGISVHYSIAVDYPPEYSVAGLGWIMVWDFTDHYVGTDLEMISLQTGGSMETEDQSGAVALTSDESFADYWNPEDTGGYYGNWEFDGDEEVEPLGPLEVVSAVEYGEGRVVVVGDQNIFGDAWTHFGDNFELAMNAFEWTAKQEDVAEVPLRDIKPKGTLIGQDQRHSEYSGGKPSRNNFWVFYVNNNRDPEITARGSIRFENEEDVLFLMSPSVEFTERDVADVRRYLESGKKVVVTFEPNSASPAVIGLLRELAPEFSVTDGVNELRVTDEEPATLAAEKIVGEMLPVTSELLDVDGLSVGIYDGDPSEAEDPSEFPPYLWNVTSSWGEPFLQASADGDTIDLARYAEVDGGELIVFVQDGFFRNRSMGEYLRSPRDYNEDNNELQYRLLDYVKVEQPDDPDPDGDDDDDEPPVGDDDPFDSPTQVCR